MVQDSMPWGGEITGDANSADLFTAPYSDDEWSDMFTRFFIRDRTAQGVIGGYENELAVSDAGGSTMRVATGAALVDGKLYENTANVDGTSSGNSVHWLVGLKKDFVAQEVRIFFRGTYASAAAALAALVQNDDVVWEIPLATVLTDGAGAVSGVTDQRSWAVRVQTKQLFVPCVGVFNFTDAQIEPRATIFGWNLVDAKLCVGYGDFTVPLDYKSGTDLTIKALVEADAAGNIERSLSYRKREGCDEAVGSTVVLVASGTEAIGTPNQTVCLAESTIPSVEAGWAYTVSFERDATQGSDTINDIAYFVGFVIEYMSLVP